MFGLNSRFQIAAILFLIVIIYDYVKYRKIPLYSTKFFSWMMLFASINLVADIATVYTITHMDEVPAVINRFAHQIFIGSLDCCIMSLYFYVSALGKNQKRHNLIHTIIRLIPFAVAMVLVVFGELKYYNDGVTAYSYGIMATTVYASIVFYILFIFVDLIKYRKTISPDKILAISLGATVWVIAAIIQFLFPRYLLSGLFSILMIFFIYLSFENPKEHIDAETQCFNKRAFHLMLSDVVESGKPFYVVEYIISDMKTVNNSFGHEYGIKLLIEIAKQIATCSNTRVFYVRSNGLTVILKSNENELITQLMALENRFKEAWDIGDNSITVTAFANVVACPKYAVSTDEIYDTLNYMAEQQVFENQFIHSINEDYIKRKRRYNMIEEIVKDAVQNDKLDVVYQPIYSVADKAFVSAEALVRLRDTTTLGFISPDEFIPIAEKRGMIMKLGELVFEKVCRFAKENDLQGFGIKYIEVNLSGIQCIDYMLPAQLQSIMKKYKISPSFINLEITETAAIESGDMLKKNMNKLRGMGCSFSMDDFGTGYSNLSQMVAVNYDLVKIDKSLIWPCFEENGEKALVILENIVNMLLQLGVKIVAEGVETVAQLNKLTMLGVDYMQGYFYSKPVNETDFISFVATHNK